jgi:hypothetical protein
VRRFALWALYFGLGAGFLGASDNLGDKVRGWYVRTSSRPGYTVCINFGLEASFWFGHLSLNNYDNSTVWITQPITGRNPECFHPASQAEAEVADLRLFFDARFWDPPAHPRMVLVRRVQEKPKKQSTIYVEPMP